MLLQAFRHNETLWQLPLLGDLPNPQESVNWGWNQDGKTLWVKTSNHQYVIDGAMGNSLEQKKRKGP